MRFWLVLIGIWIGWVSMPAMAQQIVCIVKDAQTNLPIQGVHIYDNTNPHIGTVTNSEGTFSWNVSSEVSLVFTHVGYHLIILHSTDLLASKSVQLKPLIFPLNEVVVEAIGSNEIMQRVIDRLEENHIVEPVYYRFHSRIVEMACDSSKVYSLEEISGYLEQNENHNSSFHLTKSRFAYFDKSAKNSEDGRRFIGGTGLYMDNILRYKKGYLNKRELKKNYQLTYHGDTHIGDFDCYIIHFKKLNDKPGESSGWLYIEKETYGIARLQVNSDENAQFQRDTYFQRVNNKWYLSYASRKLIHCRKMNYLKIVYTSERQTLYQRVDSAPDGLKFTDKTFLSPKFVNDYISDYDDPYWQENPFIPLPEWLQRMIDSSERLKP